MATYFSNLIGADGTTDTAIEVGKRADPGLYGAIVKVARARATFTPAANDVVRFFSLPSGARLLHLFFSSGDMGGAHTVHLGLHKAGTAHDGAAIDVDVFAASIDTGTAAVARTEELTQSGLITESLRGDYLWKMADAGAATLAADPFEDWDITMTVATSATPQSTTVTIEAWYV